MIDDLDDDASPLLGTTTTPTSRGADTWYYRTVVEDDRGDGDMTRACAPLASATHLRLKYKGGDTYYCPSPPSLDDFSADLNTVMNVVTSGPVRSSSRHRLQILEHKFKIHTLMNRDIEEKDLTVADAVKAEDVVRVDNHISLARMFRPREFLRSLKTTKHNEDREKLKLLIDGALSLTPPTLSLLAMQSFRDLVTAHLKRQADVSPSTMREIAVSYGGQDDEFASLGRCLSAADLPFVFGDKTVRWTLSMNYQHSDKSANVSVFVRSWFKPLIESCTSAEENTFSQHIGVISVHIADTIFVAPSQASSSSLTSRAPASALLFCVWSELQTLNKMRIEHKGWCPVLLRAVVDPTCEPLVLLPTYLLCDSVVHPDALEKLPSLQYLFYLTRIPVVLSLLSERTKTSEDCAGGNGSRGSVVSSFVATGMCVSLCTLNPLRTHFSDEPLEEEYATCVSVHGLHGVDVYEMYRQSILTSAFSRKSKESWLGVFYQRGINGNDFDKCQVPNVRLLFREEAMLEEYRVINTWLRNRASEVMMPDFRLTVHVGKQRTSSFVRQDFLASRLSVEDLVDEDTRIRYSRLSFKAPPLRDVELEGAARRLHHAFSLRSQYIVHSDASILNSSVNTPNQQQPTLAVDDTMDFVEHEMSSGTIEFVDGVGFVKGVSDADGVATFPPLQKYCSDLQEIDKVCSDRMIQRLARKRLRLLEEKFKLHMAVNGSRELDGETEEETQQRISHRDFYQTTKVDNHVHMAAGMTSRQLLDYILERWFHDGDDIVEVTAQGKPRTLKSVLSEIGVAPHELTVHHLGVVATQREVFERFDNFNTKYNPMGKPQLRNLFLKTSNYMGGRYFAELCKKAFAEMRKDEFVFAENRLSVYGMKRSEWSELATWFATYGVASPANRWVIQVPRIYPVLKSVNKVQNFAELMENIFRPLWEVTLNPQSDPKLHHFLTFVAGFDSVDDESSVDVELTAVLPQLWTSGQNPPYNYWCYYMSANIHALNVARRRRGFSTFEFRPHCGEGGAVRHLIGGFLTCHSVNHGINLRKDDVLQYLFYLAQIPLTMSPLSNNMLFLEYQENPFPQFLQRGLRVTLSTDDPLFFHHTQEPLIEEYSIAAKVWKLGPNDLCEIARTSVLMSGFSHEWKSNRLGELFYLSSERGNCEALSHLSDVRVAYRFDQYHDEMSYLSSLTQGLNWPRAMLTSSEEIEILHQRALNNQSASMGINSGGGLSSLAHGSGGHSDLFEGSASVANRMREVSRKYAAGALLMVSPCVAGSTSFRGGDMSDMPLVQQLSAQPSLGDRKQSGMSGSFLQQQQQAPASTLFSRLRINPLYNRRGTLVPGETATGGGCCPPSSERSNEKNNA
eukprot:PhM_4_TR10722/c0_g1_i1/m.13102/K01490/AMPD; AMP deaminase